MYYDITAIFIYDIILKYLEKIFFGISGKCEENLLILRKFLRLWVIPR